MKIKRSIRLTGLLFLLSFSTLIGQSIDRSVIATQGAEFTNPAVGSIEWTMGETVTESFDDCFLTQGFRQTFEISGCGFSNIEEVPIHSNLMLFPNPAIDKLNIISESGPIKHIYIFNTTGSLVFETSGDNNIQQIVTITSIPAGQYIIRVQLEREILNQQFIKID